MTSRTKTYVIVAILFLMNLAFLFSMPSEVARAVDEAGFVSTYGKCEGAGGFVPLECFQGSAKLRDAYNTPELGPFLQKLFVGAISLGAILAVLRLAWAGFMYMGSDMWGQKEHAKEIIRDALLGLFLLLAIWLILNQINPDILKLKINSSSVPSDVTQKQPM